MTLSLRIMAPNRIVCTDEVQEIILSTNSGQVGILPNHAPLLTALDIGIIKIRLKEQWSTMALMGGFAMIENNKMIVLVNEAEKSTEIDFREAQETFVAAKKNLARASNKKQSIEAGLAFKRAKARMEALNANTSDISD